MVWEEYHLRFAGFSVDQWKNWVTVFSPIALKDLLPANDGCCLSGPVVYLEVG